MRMTVCKGGIKMSEQKIYALLGRQFFRKGLWGLAIAAIGLGLNVLTTLKMYYSKEAVLGVSFNLPYVLIILFLITVGWQYSAREYAGLMGIQARRTTYLKGMMVIGIVGSLVMLSLVYSIIQGFTFLTAYLFKDYTVETSFYLNLRGIMSLWGIGEIAFALGFFLGALTYRFKTITAVSLISFLPLLGVTSILSHYLFEDELSMYWMFVMLWLAKSFVSDIGQPIYIVFFLGLGWQLLKRAPIECYAHDLL